jgi:hypothetical protein
MPGFHVHASSVFGKEKKINISAAILRIANPAHTRENTVRAAVFSPLKMMWQQQDASERFENFLCSFIV